MGRPSRDELAPAIVQEMSPGVAATKERFGPYKSISEKELVISLGSLLHTGEVVGAKLGAKFPLPPWSWII